MWPSLPTFLSFLSGLIFGLGLIVAGMSDPAKVQAFLDLAGPWDPSLALTMAAAVGVSLPAFAWARRSPTTWSGHPLELPPPRAVDSHLLLGSALFGIGWGLTGLCPGPAVLSLGSGYLPGIAFAMAMVFGMEAYDWGVNAGKIRPSP